MRGGSDHVYEEEEKTKNKMVVDEEEAYEEEVEEEEIDEHTLQREESHIDAETEEDEEYVGMEHEEIFHDDEEEEDSFVPEETMYEEEPLVNQVVVEEDEEEDEEMLVSELKDDSVNKDDVSIPFTTTQEVLERATAGTNTDDENSSAFVDRMELADAYDLEETGGEVVDDVESMAAVSAIAGGSDPEEEAVTETTVTDDIRQILVKELNFTPQDVRVLRPEIAAMIVTNMLRKPIEGMPANWYLPGMVQTTGKLRQVMLKASITVAAMGAVALLVVKGQESIDLDQIQETLSKIPTVLVGVWESTKRAFPKVAEEIIPPVQEEEVEEVVEVEMEEEEEEEHPHSIKPGATDIPAYEQDLDKTALDKLITKIENVIKAFFRITI